MSDIRTPIHNDDAERSMLGACFVSDGALEKALAICKPCDLYRDAHRHFYRAMIAAHEEHGRIDYVLVSEELNARGLLDAVGGALAVSKLADEVPSSANIEIYAALVARHARARRLVRDAERLADDVHTGKVRPEDWTARVRELEHVASEEARAGELISWRDATREAWDDVARRARGEDVGELSTGSPNLDALVRLRRGELVLVGARPAMGKSLWLGLTGLHLAREGRGGLIVSLEMAAERWAWRQMIAVANEGGDEVAVDAVKGGALTTAQMAALQAAAAEVSDLPLWCLDTPALHIDALCAEAREAVERRGAEWIGVDYLQLIRGEGYSREERLGEVAQRLKQLARELDVPVIALAQLNRKLEDREDKRPQKADFRGSGKLEQAADVMAALHRPHVYDASAPKDELDLVVLKNRNGGIGTAQLRFFGEQLRIVDADTRYDESFDHIDDGAWL